MQSILTHFAHLCLSHAELTLGARCCYRIHLHQPDNSQKLIRSAHINGWCSAGGQSAAPHKGAGEEDNNSDDDWSRGGKAAKGKKGTKGKKQGSSKGPPQAKSAAGKVGSAASAQQPAPAGGRGKTAAANANSATAARLLSLEALTEKVLEWLPEVGTLLTGDYDGMSSQ